MTITVAGNKKSTKTDLKLTEDIEKEDIESPGVCNRNYQR